MLCHATKRWLAGDRCPSSLPVCLAPCIFLSFQVVVMVDGRDPSTCLPMCSLLQAAEMFVPGVPDVTVHQNQTTAAAAGSLGGGPGGAGTTPAGTSSAATSSAAGQQQQLHVSVPVQATFPA